MSSTLSRTPLIDMVKGVACAAIVAHHLAFYGPMSDIALPLAPDLMAWLYDYARMAVQVFLVLGGYLAAASLAPTGVARFEAAGPPMARRFVRLVVPYVAALVLTLVVAALVRPWFSHESVPADPSLWQLLSHAFLLHGVVGQESLSAGVWYVAIDFQLFALAVMLLALVRALLPARWVGVAGPVLVVLGAAASLWGFNRNADWDVWALYFFGAYAMGVLAYWAVHAPQARACWGWVAIIAALGGVALAIEWRDRIALALVTALWLVWALRSPRWSSWQGWPALVRLGQRSYSVFLIHFSVCLLVNAVVSSLWPASPAINAAGMVLAWGLSLWAGHLLYHHVERHVPTLTTALRWQAGLVATGLLLELAGYLG